MALWTFTEVADKLECSQQNVYSKKNRLKQMGFVELDIDGKEKINDSRL